MPSCPSCGADVADGAKFCASCGQELTNRADERRVVTVVFGDLVGFTAMSENADPERVKRLIDDVFAVLADDIVSFGGHVDKVVGDGIVALFGATIAHEDDAERAVRAGLRMQHSVADFAERENVPLQMRIGVNTGEVLIGSMSADGYWTAMGDVVNTASRLQSMAEPGAVVVGEETHEATHLAVFYQPIGDLELRGRGEAVPAWIARTVLGLPGQRSGREPRPIVGREGEVSLLCNAIDSAFERRRSFTVLVAGESGVGRSRLIDEVVSYATEQHSAALLEAPCVPYGEADRWFPVAELVRYAIGIRLGDPPAAARAAVSDGLSVAFGADADDAVVRRATTGLMHLLGYETPLAGIEPERAAIEAARAFRASLQARLNRQPVVLSLSDLQWADDVVLRLVSGLMARLVRTPLVIIASTTHDLFERWSPQPGRSNMLVLSLDPLDALQSTALVRQIVGDDLDDFTVAEIVDRGGGNPFFLEELAELVANDDSADIAAVPHNVRGVIAARLDSIPVSDRELLEHAAVLGRRGPIDGLRRMAEVLKQGGFDESLQRLTESDLLRVDRERWEFPSDLLHEIAYSRLAKSERARRHAGVAVYLEEHGGALPESIAGHYRRAALLERDLGSVEGVPDDIADRAIETTRGIIGTRRAAAATRRAVEALTEALEVAPAGHPQRDLLRVDRARVLVLARELERAGEDLDAVLSEKELDESVLAAAELVRGELLQIRGEFEQSIQVLGSANERFERIGDPAGSAESTRLSGMSMLYQGNSAGAEDMLHRALELSIECQDLAGEAWVRQNLAWMSFARGRISEAKERIDEAIGLFAEIGDGVGITWGRGLLAYVHLYEGDLDGAALLAEEVLAEAEEQGEKWGKGMMLVLLGSVSLWSGHPFEAVDRAEESVALFSEIEDALGSMQAEAVLGRAYVRAGRVQEARALFARTIDALTTAPREGTAELVPTSAAAAMVTLGDPESARTYLAALDPGDDDVGNLGSSERLVTTAMVALQSGDAAGAVQQLQAVIDATGELRVDTSANASLALAAVVAGELGRARRHSAVVSESPNASYPDREFAIVARVMCEALDGDEDAFGEALTELRRLRRSGEDQMTRMISLMAEAAALGAVGHAEAAQSEEELQELLSQLGIEPSGWRRVFEDAFAQA